MFSVYSVQGRIFNGTLEQWRQVARVSAPARTHAIRPSTRESREAAIDDRLSSSSASDVHRAALTAYAQTRQGAAARRPLSRVDDVMSRDVVTVRLDATLAQAWQLLAQHAIGDRRRPWMAAALWWACCAPTCCNLASCPDPGSTRRPGKTCSHGA